MWGVYIFTILGVAYLVLLGVVYGVEAIHPFALIGALYFFMPLLNRLALSLHFHRQLARLREQGYDVSELEQKPRVAVEPLMRVHAPSEEQSVDAVSAVSARSSAFAEEAAASEAVSDEVRPRRLHR
jgi:hypothetical protein